MTERTRPARAMAAYSLGRLGLFVLCLLVFYFTGVGTLLALILAAVVSGIAGYFLLARQRVALSVAVDAKLTSVRERTAARTAREDEAADALLAQQDQQDQQQP